VTKAVLKGGATGTVRASTTEMAVMDSLNALVPIRIT
jgi:hypothetical protein